MEITKLNSILHSDAKTLNACDKVMGQWTHDLNAGELINLYVHNQEFCIEKDFPSVPFILSNFTVEDRQKHNVYISDNVCLRNPSGIAVVGGRTKGIIMSDGFDASTLYIRHNSDVTISCKGFSRLFIHIHNESVVHIIQEEESKVFVYVHGDQTKITTEGEVTIRQK